MMWYDSPTHPSMWLSDPDTHPFVSQVIRIYHAEKHSLNQNRVPPPASATTTDSSISNSSSLSSSAEPSVLRNSTRPGEPSVPGTSVTTSYGFSVRSSEGQPHPQFSSSLMPGQCPQIFITVRNNGSGAEHTPSLANWFSNAAINRSSPPRTTPPALNPSQIARINPEEPMSHSGSPVRGSVPSRVGPEVPNGVSMNLVEPSSVYSMSVEQQPAADVEMEDSLADSQAMDTQ